VPPAEAARRRAARLQEIFGDVVPGATTDDQRAAAEDVRERHAADEQLRRDVPPHHGS
jgi:hypothetical protein